MHSRSTQVRFRQELRLLGSHEAQQPARTASALIGRLLEESAFGSSSSDGCPSITGTVIAGKWLNRALPDTSHKITLATLMPPSASSPAAGTLVGAACAACPTGDANDQADLAAAPAHDRRHENPQHVAEHPRRSTSAPCQLQRLPSPLAGQARRRGRARLSASSDLARPQAGTIIPIMCGIRFFYGTTLGRKDMAEQIPLARKEDTLPAVLTQKQVARFLKANPISRCAPPSSPSMPPACASPRPSH